MESKSARLAQQHISLEGVAADRRLDAQREVGIAPGRRHRKVWVGVVPDHEAASRQ